ncbi:MAG: prephenate dehydratase [Pseudanabaenaceae cyanobacterium bins.68]|nr:prephenate dehydratase [Pseudanabaenaceae cyanobacterium bins.68]
MEVSAIAYLGPVGTYSELAAWSYVQQFAGRSLALIPYPTIPQAIRSVGKQQLAIVPAENSIQGSVTMTLDTIWELEGLQILQAVDLPIQNALVANVRHFSQIQRVYSHPQPLAQCQTWLDTHLGEAVQVATNSTVEGLEIIKADPNGAAIASIRAAQIYQIPVLACPINDHPENHTRFWVLGLGQSEQVGSHTSIAFSVGQNLPGALVTPLAIFAERGINLSRIESRPTKRSLGDYIFFADLEAGLDQPEMQEAIAALADVTERLKILGSYQVSSLETQQ